MAFITMSTGYPIITTINHTIRRSSFRSSGTESVPDYSTCVSQANQQLTMTALKPIYHKQRRSLICTAANKSHFFCLSNWELIHSPRIDRGRKKNKYIMMDFNQTLYISIYNIILPRPTPSKPHLFHNPTLPNPPHNLNQQRQPAT